MNTFSNKHIKNLAQGLNEPIWNGKLRTDFDGQNIKRHTTHRRWDPLIYHSPLAATENSSDLSKGITGTTIGKRINDNRALTAKNRVKDRLPTLQLQGHSRRKYQSDNVKIKITIKNRLMRRYDDNGSKGAPIECFKVTSLKSKNHK